MVSIGFRDILHCVGISVVGGSVVLEESLEVSEGLHLAYSPPPSSTEQVRKVV